MNNEEIKKALEALEIADKKLYKSEECSLCLYNEVSDYIKVAKDILTREQDNRRSHSAPTDDKH